jgi:hypothetical protein
MSKLVITHQYDIVFDHLKKSIDINLEDSKLSHSDKEMYKGKFETICSLYNESIQGTKSISSRIVKSSSPSYINLLCYALSCIDIPKLKSFLDYHYRTVKPSIYIKNKTDFPGNLEFILYPSMKAVFITHQEERLSQIMEWVRAKKEIQSRARANNIVKKKLAWIENHDKLNKLSTMVHDEGFTTRSNSFKNVFEHGEVCKWIAQPNLIIHLIYLLKKLNVIEVTPGGKGHFLAASKLFSDYSDSQNQKIDFKRSSSYIVNNPQNYSKIIEKVNSWLVNCGFSINEPDFSPTIR